MLTIFVVNIIFFVTEAMLYPFVVVLIARLYELYQPIGYAVKVSVLNGIIDFNGCASLVKVVTDDAVTKRELSFGFEETFDLALEGLG
jgi:hypothetical protein